MKHELGQGSRSRYIKGCRCDECRADNAAYSRLWVSRNPESRRKTRTTICPECGGAMSAGNGAARDPVRCEACQLKRLEANRLPCGTRASYVRGCRCRPCTDAVVAYQRRLKRKGAA